jgi:hypothetical protein
MLNKYDKVYSEFIEKVAELHNAHIAFKTKPTHEPSLRLKRAITDVQDHMYSMRTEVMSFREAYTAEQKRLWAEHREQLRVKEEAKARRREERQKRKNNEHTTRTTGSV